MIAAAASSPARMMAAFELPHPATKSTRTRRIPAWIACYPLIGSGKIRMRFRQRPRMAGIAALALLAGLGGCDKDGVVSNHAEFGSATASRARDGNLASPSAKQEGV